MYQKLLQRLNQFVLLNPQQQRDLCKALKVIEVTKDDCLLSQGQVANHLYFITSGVIRACCEVEGKEVTRWFSKEGDIAASYFSFVYRQPSEDDILPITDTRLLALSHTALKILSQQDTVLGGS